MFISMLADVQKAIAKLPAPISGGMTVYPKLIALIEETDKRCVENKNLLMGMVAMRADFCKAGYGQYLLTLDGRDTQTECIQEVLDLMIYMMKAYMETENPKWYQLIHIVMMVANELLRDHLFKGELNGTPS